MKIRYETLILLLFICPLWSQEQIIENQLSLEEAFSLAVKNSVQLKVSMFTAVLAREQTDILKLNQLPGISTGVTYGYLSNSDIWTPSFSGHRTVEFPHVLNQFSLQAAEVVFKGGLIKNSIKKSEQEEQIADLRLQKNTEDIKFLVTAKYLDIFRSINQKKIYINNTKLSQQRLENILSMHKQGMVTQNDVLRTELIISNLKIATLKADNNIDILNQQLNVILGLEKQTRLIPDPAVLNLPDEKLTIDDFLSEAKKKNYEIRIAAAEKDISNTNLKITESDRYPEISLFAGSNLQRPFLNSMPAVDIFYNVWQAGVALRYNISSIYQVPRRLRSGNTALEQSNEKQVLAQQEAGLSVSSSFIKYKESREELDILTDDLKSAEENYRIVEKKYLNQLALLADMTDAINIKIESEIRLTNARINIIYTYYQLLKSAGMLE